MSIIIKPKTIELKENAPPIEEYRWKSSDDLGKSLNLKDFTCNIRSLEKGKFSYPYHFHHNVEELFVIISGKGELRTPQGIKQIESGDIAIFEKGETGAHQLFNPNSEALLYLDLRTLKNFDACEYPDTNKVNMLPQKDIFYKGDNVDYFEGEQNIHEIWARLSTGK